MKLYYVNIIALVAILFFIESCIEPPRVEYIENVVLEPYGNGQDGECGRLISYRDENEDFQLLHPIEVADSLITSNQPRFSRMKVAYLDEEYSCIRNHPLIEEPYPPTPISPKVVEILEVEY